MKAKATIRLHFSSEKKVATLLDALAPEAKRPVNVRVRLGLEKEGNFVILKVEAKDTVALRAALNAYLRWIGSTKRVIEVVEETL